MKDLEGKVALVTGASRCIGFASAEILAKHGALVYIAAPDSEDALDILESEGLNAKFIYFNAMEKDTYKNMIDKIIKENGKLDILVNNYGGTNVNLDKNVVDGDTEEFFNILKNNISSVYLPSKLAIPHMIKNGGGSIINISSIGSIVPDLSRTAYCVSKAAINSLTQNIALQYADKNIRCNAVLPGLIGTKAAMGNMTDDFLDSFVKHIPLHRIGKPEDIANAVLYYASDFSSFVTGMIHEVAGGYALGTPQYSEHIY